MDVRCLTPQSAINAASASQLGNGAGPLHADQAATQDRAAIQTQLRRLELQILGGLPALGGAQARVHLKAVPRQRRRRSDDSNGTVARSDITGDADSDVDVTDTELDAHQQHAVAVRSGSEPGRTLPEVMSKALTEALTNARIRSQPRESPLARVAEFVESQQAQAQPTTAVASGPAATVSGRRGASRSRKHAAPETKAAPAPKRARRTRTPKQAEVSNPAAITTANPNGTTSTPATTRAAPAPPALRPAQAEVHAQPPPAASAATVGSTVRAPPPTATPAAPGRAQVQQTMSAIACPAPSKPSCGSDVAPRAPPAAQEVPTDLAGCPFVPAGKVSNDHVVGRQPIGFTPFYPTIDLKCGKHAVMQVYNGMMKSDFLRFELPAMRASLCEHVLSVLDVVDHGDAVLVFREPFVTDLHTQLRKFGRFEEDHAREFFAQILRIVADMHSKDIVLGASLRLNTVVLTSKDMATAKLASLEAAHTTNGFGRAEVDFLTTATCLAYAPPELVNQQQTSPVPASAVGKSCDMWALGVMLYSMLNGSFPFVSHKTDPDAARDEIREKIIAGKWALPSQPRFSLAAHSLLRLLLEPSPDQRATAESILSHPWVLGSTVLTANTLPRPYDASPDAAFCSAASDSLLATMQSRTPASDDQLVPSSC